MSIKKDRTKCLYILHEVFSGFPIAPVMHVRNSGIWSGKWKTTNSF